MPALLLLFAICIAKQAKEPCVQSHHNLTQPRILMRQRSRLTLVCCMMHTLGACELIYVAIHHSRDDLLYVREDATGSSQSKEFPEELQQL